jgi:hypothetical protein
MEECIFQKIEIHFLIVGHTHSSIDQFFSVLSKAIGESSFIGSPLALISLFEQYTAGSKKKTSTTISLKILIARQIIVYYDFASAISPFVNKKIKVIQILFVINYYFNYYKNFLHSIIRSRIAFCSLWFTEER